MKKNIWTILIFILPLIFSGTIALAADTSGGSGGSGGSDGLNIENPLGSINNISSLMQNLINVLWNLSVVIAPILIVYAGFLYITSAGNQEKIQKAQKTLIWTLIGFAVVLLANSMPNIIQSFLS